MITEEQITAAVRAAGSAGGRLSRDRWRAVLEAVLPEPAPADVQVEAVLDVLAPKPDLPPGFDYAPGLADLRIPRILVEYDRQPVRPDDRMLRAIAEQIVTAIGAI